MMKQLITILLVLIGCKGFAQEIGIRLGDFGNSNVAIDGIVNFDDNTRMHGDITFGNGIGAHLLYDFTVKPFNIDRTSFQYYLGAGVGTFIGDPFILGANGEAGIEYMFKEIPISIGLDWRPQLNIITKTSLDIFQFGFNVRYRINEL